MSTIEVRQGSARVELDAQEFHFNDGDVAVSYDVKHAVQALVRVLKAADTQEADTWLRVLVTGAEAEGVSL